MTTSKLRVLVVSPYGTPGGAESWLRTLLNHTERLDAFVVLLADGPFRSELAADGVPVSVLPVGRRARDLLGPIASLTRELRQTCPDVVLANGVKAALVTVPAGLLSGTRIVWAKHDHSFDRPLAPLVGRLCDAVVAAVEELAEPVRRADVLIVPPPAAGEPPADRETAREYLTGQGLTFDDRPCLVMAGRLVPYKGVDDAIRALVRATHWRLVVIGDDDASAQGERVRLERLARELGLQDRVTFVARVPAVHRWLAAFDALAVLTRPGGRRTPGKEGFGTSAFEAMRAGVPVVAVAGGAVVRRLEGRAGIGVPPASPDDVAAALESLSDERTRHLAGEAGRRLVADHPGAAETARRLVGALAVVARRPGAGASVSLPMSVVVPVYNEGPLVDDAIQQLLRQVRPDDQIVVVDDCSTDDTLSRARTWATSRPDIVTLVARDRNGGVGAARNSGVAACRNDAIAFTDAGCLLDPLWLESLRSALDEEPPPDFVAGTYRVSSRSTVEAAVAVACYPDVSEAVHPSLLARAYGRIFGRAFDATRPAGRSMAFRRAAYLQVGGFREDMAATEDIDFSRAVARAGLHCVLAADASMTWFQDPTLKGTARMYARYGRGDSASADRQAVARDLVRAGALLGAPLMAWSGRRWVRGAVAGGAVAYLSLPLARARRHDHPFRVAVAVPVVLMVKDVAKAYGCLAGLGSRLLPRSGHGGGG